jgi:hypothetical protein
MFAGAGTFQPERPLSDGGTLASVSPVGMKFYVCVLVPRASHVYSHVLLSSYFCTPRIRITELKAPWTILRSPCSRKVRDITAIPLYDHALRRPLEP